MSQDFIAVHEKSLRELSRPRYDLIPKIWLDALASIFEEGLKKYGSTWKTGDEQFFLDCLNHAQDHLSRYNEGDRSEAHLAKVAWNVLAALWKDYAIIKGDLYNNANNQNKSS